MTILDRFLRSWRAAIGCSSRSPAAASTSPCPLPSSRSRTLRNRWLWACILSTALKLWLVSAQTLHAIAPLPGDDQLFVKLAASIVRGEWLGRLDEFTLVKGPGYPLWLALNDLMGMRLLVSQAVLYALACAVFALAFRPAVAAPRRAVLYLLLLFNPASWADGPATRVLREGLYPSLTILLLGLATGSALRLRDEPRRSACWAAATGLVGALLVMTREEGVWLVPSLAIISATGLALLGRAALRRTILPVTAAVVAFSIPTAAVATLNWKHYGLFETCEVRAGYFTSAYGALTRVRPSSWNPYVPVPREVRARVSEVSPAFREISPTLEFLAPGWISHGCRALGVCDDIAGGWFMWSLRDAVARTGQYEDGRRARDWYERLTREVDQACRQRLLDCLPARSTMMPPWRSNYLSPLLSAIGRGAAFASTFAGITPYPGPSEGSAEDLAEYARITHERIPEPRVEILGAVESRVGEIRATVLDSSGHTADATVRRAALQPVTSTEGKGIWRTRLSVDTTCTSDCQLVLFSADRRAIAVPIVDVRGKDGGPDLMWTTEDFHRDVVPLRDAATRHTRQSVLAMITRAYQLMVPPLLVAALAVFLWRLARAVRARTLPTLSMFALGLLVGVAARLVILALLEVTSVPAIITTYMSPAYVLLIAFAALVLVADRGASRPGTPPAP